MKNYDVVFSWTKFISFPNIEAESKEEAQQKAEDMLGINKCLVEEDGSENWEITEIN